MAIRAKKYRLVEHIAGSNNQLFDVKGMKKEILGATTMSKELFEQLNANAKTTGNLYVKVSEPKKGKTAVDKEPQSEQE